MGSGVEQAVQQAATALRAARYVTALAGAGLSAESGIPTFRGPQGLWTRFGEPPMDGYQRFLRDPAAYWQEQLQPTSEGPRAELVKALETAQPNPGHLALAELEQMGVLRFLITQNIDNLHARAGSQQMVEVHGNRSKLRCIACDQRYARSEFSVSQVPPSCPQCGGLVKVDTVMFGEPIPSRWLQACHAEAAASDCMLLVGTSGTVYPAAAFPQMVKERGGSLIEVNPLETHLTRWCDVVIRAPAAEALPLLVQRLRALQGKPNA
ncbi:MAG: NAD-dependent deacylase [Chloroflexi bacterium]|nr:NAD-dependent deacylase [Chloroflexota bacterium]